MDFLLRMTDNFALGAEYALAHVQLGIAGLADIQGRRGRLSAERDAPQR
jgi:hypothetical protein